KPVRRGESVLRPTSNLLSQSYPEMSSTHSTLLPPSRWLRPGRQGKTFLCFAADFFPEIDKACAGFFFGRLARVVRIGLGKATLIARPHFDCRRVHRYLATKSCSRNLRMAGAAIAPAWCATSIPFLKIDIV